jgi:hypothetical protein
MGRIVYNLQSVELFDRGAMLGGKRRMSWVITGRRLSIKMRPWWERTRGCSIHSYHTQDISSRALPDISIPLHPSAVSGSHAALDHIVHTFPFITNTSIPIYPTTILSYHPPRTIISYHHLTPTHTFRLTYNAPHLIARKNPVERAVQLS